MRSVTLRGHEHEVKSFLALNPAAAIFMTFALITGTVRQGPLAAQFWYGWRDLHPHGLSPTWV